MVKGITVTLCETFISASWHFETWNSASMEALNLGTLQRSNPCRYERAFECAGQKSQVSIPIPRAIALIIHDSDSAMINTCTGHGLTGHKTQKSTWQLLRWNSFVPKGLHETQTAWWLCRDVCKMKWPHLQSRNELSQRNFLLLLALLLGCKTGSIFLCDHSMENCGRVHLTLVYRGYICR